jgi:hypothetical protein
MPNDESEDDDDDGDEERQTTPEQAARLKETKGTSATNYCGRWQTCPSVVSRRIARQC